MIRFLAISSLLVLSACDARTPNDMASSARTVWTDPETGCNYIVVDEVWGQTRVYGITIRFRADGTPDCGQ